MKEWYTALSEREQKLVSAAAIVAILLIFYFAVWSPISSATAEQKIAVESDKKLLSWVQEQSNRANILRQSSNSTSFSGSLTQVVNQTTRGTDIDIARMQPQGEELMVSIDQVIFNEFIKWLSVLENRGVVIIQSDVSEVDSLGYVQVRRLQLGKS